MKRRGSSKAWVFLFLAAIFAVALPFGLAQTKTTVTYWTHVNPPSQAIEKKLIERYLKDNPNVEIEYAPVDFVSLPTKLTTAFAGGGGPDIFNYFQSYAPALVQRGFLASVDFKAFGGSLESFKTQYQPAVVNGYSFGGNVYGIPHEVSSFAFWVNGAHFKEVGLDAVKNYPKTWVDVTRIGKKLTNANREGIVMPLYNPVRDMLIFDTLARQAGGGLFSDDGKTARLNSASAVKALKTWGDMIHVSKINDPKLGPTASTDSLDLFGNGTAAMNPAGGSWFTSILEQQYPNVYKNYVVGQYPIMAGGPAIGADLYGFGLFVAKTSKNQTETWKFARFLADNGDDYFTEASLWLGDLKTLNSSATKDFPHWDVFKTAFSRGFFLPPLTNYNELTQIIERAIQRVVLSGQSAKDSLEQAQTEAVPLMK